MRRYIRALICAAAVAAAACDESLTTIAGPTPNLTPDFATIQRDVLGAGDPTGRRACISCHNATGSRFAAGLNMDTADAYDRLVNARSTRKPGAILIIPGDPDHSYLVQ